VLFQLPESLEDMAMYISQEEWGHQDPSKRALSRDSVQESYEHVDSLGKNFLFRGDDCAISDRSSLLGDSSLGHKL
jgi:KRAB and SCAN domain-containing zinc finger protein